MNIANGVSRTMMTLKQIIFVTTVLTGVQKKKVKNDM